MTIQQMYKELERLYCRVDWGDRESIRRYNEKAWQYRKMVDEGLDQHEGTTYNHDRKAGKAQ